MELQKDSIVLSGVKRRNVIRRGETELPEDIIKNEILTRLPPKSLVRFMLVYKSWKALISSSEFVNSHLIQQQSYKDREHFIAGNGIFFGDGVRIISRSAEAHAILGPSGFNILVGSINGLICIASYGENFCILNPAIGQIKKMHPSYYCQRHKCIRQHLIGFSWDHKKNDYKIVIVCNDADTPTSMKLSIYSSNACSWTEVLIPDSVVPESDRYILGCCRQITPCTIVKGDPYWSCPKYENLSDLKLYVFKFVAENNEFRSLPDLYSVGLRGKEFNFVNIRDRLSVLVYTEHSPSLADMYFLDEECSNGVWSKMYSIGPIRLPHLRPHCFKNSGDILVVTSRPEPYIYDTKTKKWKSVDTPHYIKDICYCYTPSLVCVEGMQFDGHIIREDKRTEKDYCK